MAVFTPILMLFCLTLFAGGLSEDRVPSTEVKNAVTRAVSWMLSQRQDDYSWGPFTSRAIVALVLSQEVQPLPKEEMNLMTKQLNILLSLELGKDLSTQSMALSRLALYVNALYATCQSPRNFHGLDLVRILRSRTDAMLADTSDFNLPVVFLSLCLAKEAKYEDVRILSQIYYNHRNKTDLQALELLALSCISHQDRSQSTKQRMDSLMVDFSRNFNNLPHSSDGHTLALAIQALNTITGQPVNVSPLLQKQLPDGSFGSLLGTYHALPALLGKSVLAIKNVKCSNESSPDGFVPFSDSGTPNVYYSLWIGEGNDKDSHTITVTLTANVTFFDIMQMAQARNPNFRFSYDETNSGKRVYSLSGIPNEVERELYWILYRTKDGPNGPNPKRNMQKMKGGVDRIYSSSEDHYIFWFKRDNSP